MIGAIVIILVFYCPWKFFFGIKEKIKEKLRKFIFFEIVHFSEKIDKNILGYVDWH